MARIGVRRISVGGALARTAWTGFLESAREIATDGTFNGLARAITSAELEQRFTPGSGSGT
jgi:2-methylisocitrate lyase-like PEP mutase family enzyme